MFLIITFIIVLISFLLYTRYNTKITIDYYHNPQEKILLLMDDALQTMNNNSLEKYLFKNVSKSVRFIPGTITTRIKTKIGCIIQPLIDTLNKLTEKQFIIMEYITVLIDLDVDNNFKLRLDFFINSIKDNKQLRLVAEIIVDNMDNKHLNYINKYNNKYNNNSDVELFLLDKTSLEHSDIKHYNTMNLERKNILPNWNPTIHGLPRDNTGLYGLFDLSVGLLGSDT